MEQHHPIESTVAILSIFTHRIWSKEQRVPKKLMWKKSSWACYFYTLGIFQYWKGLKIKAGMHFTKKVNHIFLVNILLLKRHFCEQFYSQYVYCMYVCVYKYIYIYLSIQTNFSLTFFFVFCEYDQIMTSTLYKRCHILCLTSPLYLNLNFLNHLQQCPLLNTQICKENQDTYN